MADRGGPTDWDEVTAVILAGGLGTRLQSVVSDRPKCLADVNGRPFIGYQLDRLAALGVSRVVICTGYLADHVEAAVGAVYGPLRITYSREGSPLGTGGALRLAVGAVTTPYMLVLNGDSLCDAELEVLLVASRAARGAPTLLLVHVTDTAAFGRVTWDDDAIGCRITGFLEKGVEGPGWVNAGVYLVAAADVAAIDESRPCSLERVVFPRWIASGRLRAARTAASFIDMGTPETYRRVSEYLETVRPR